MNISDYILILIQWTHHLGAVCWVGGCVFYYLVLKPVYQETQTVSLDRQRIAYQFRYVVKGAIWVLISTGIVLGISELVTQSVSNTYIVVLGVKVGFAASMFLLYVFNKESQAAVVRVLNIPVYRTDLILILGILVIGLSDILSALGAL